VGNLCRDRSWPKKLFKLKYLLMSQFCFELVFIIVVLYDCFLELALSQWDAITKNLKAHLNPKNIII
jgi:predicted Zn-dependent protease